MANYIASGNMGGAAAGTIDTGGHDKLADGGKGEKPLGLMNMDELKHVAENSSDPATRAEAHQMLDQKAKDMEGMPTQELQDMANNKGGEVSETAQNLARAILDQRHGGSDGSV